MKQTEDLKKSWLTLTVLNIRSSVVGLVFAAAAVSPALAASFVVTDLGTLGGPQTSATGINNAGQVVGNSSLAVGGTRGYRTAPNSPINIATDVIATLPGGTYSTASGINSSGQVSGSSNVAGGNNHAIRVDANGAINDLGSLRAAPSDSSNGNGINDLGQLTGATNAPPPVGPPCFGIGGSYAFRTAANSALTLGDSLGTLFPGACRGSTGFGINNLGQVVGYSAVGSLGDPVQHAMLATPGSAMVDLGVLGGSVQSPAASGINATANGINSSGQIVGVSTYTGAPAYYVTHAFLTTAAGPMTDLGTIGGAWSAANGINNAGQIVGNSTTVGDAAGHAFLYSGGVMSDLNSLIGAGSGWEVVNATGINDNGQIAGTAWLNGVAFVNHAVRLDPQAAAFPNLVAQIAALGLPNGTQNSLSSKIQAAAASAQGGNTNAAGNQLSAFINQVQAQAGKSISASSAATLIAYANAIIASL